MFLSWEEATTEDYSLYAEKAGVAAEIGNNSVLEREGGSVLEPFQQGEVEA